jgi:hypothetical protein
MLKIGISSKKVLDQTLFTIVNHVLIIDGKKRSATRVVNLDGK